MRQRRQDPALREQRRGVVAQRRVEPQRVDLRREAASGLIAPQASS